MNKYWTEFRKYNLKQRRQSLAYSEELQNIPDELGEHLIENFIGYYQLPIGVVPGIKINNKNYLVPLALEESSVVAALSRIAKLSHYEINIKSNCGERILLGHCYFEVQSPNTIDMIDLKSTEYLQRLNIAFPNLNLRNGEFKHIKNSMLFIKDQFVIKTELAINPAEAMGANLITQACEKLSVWISSDFKLRTIMSILSNKSLKSIVYSTLEYPGIDKCIGKKIEQLLYEE
jgi:degradative hydroxymethylglutaryl-CoA reductase